MKDFLRLVQIFATWFVVCFWVGFVIVQPPILVLLPFIVLGVWLSKKYGNGKKEEEQDV